MYAALIAYAFPMETTSNSHLLRIHVICLTDASVFDFGSVRLLCDIYYACIADSFHRLLSSVLRYIILLRHDRPKKEISARLAAALTQQMNPKDSHGRR